MQIPAIGNVTPGSIVGTTIDATTDFTVDGLVLTADTITNDAALLITANGTISLTDSTAADDALVYIGAPDSQSGQLVLGSDGAGEGTQGGYLQMQCAADHDDTTEYFYMSVVNDDFYLAANNDSDMIVLSGGATPSIALNAATTGTTITATTDVTLASGASLVLTPPAADNKTTGILLGGQDLDTNAYSGTGSGGIVYLNSADTAWDTADHDTLAESGPVMLAMVPTATASGDPFELLTYGLIKETAWSWTVGATLYLGNSGAMTETAPTDNGDTVRVVGHAVDATTVLFNPSPDWVVYTA
jgi:hypothetical protein